MNFVIRNTTHTDTKFTIANADANNEIYTASDGYFVFSSYHPMLFFASVVKIPLCGVHIGGSSDPGNDNLLVDGTATISTISAKSTASTQFLVADSGVIKYQSQLSYTLDSNNRFFEIADETDHVGIKITNNRTDRPAELLLISTSGTARIYGNGSISIAPVNYGKIELAGVPTLKSYSKSALPDASSYTGGLIYVNDTSGSPATIPAYSNGTNWYRVDTGTIVS